MTDAIRPPALGNIALAARQINAKQVQRRQQIAAANQKAQAAHLNADRKAEALHGTQTPPPEKQHEVGVRVEARQTARVDHAVRTADVRTTETRKEDFENAEVLQSREVETFESGSTLQGRQIPKAWVATSARPFPATATSSGVPAESRVARPALGGPAAKPAAAKAPVAHGDSSFTPAAKNPMSSAPTGAAKPAATARQAEVAAAAKKAEGQKEQNKTEKQAGALEGKLAKLSEAQRMAMQVTRPGGPGNVGTAAAIAKLMGRAEARHTVIQQRMGPLFDPKSVEKQDAGDGTVSREGVDHEVSYNDLSSLRQAFPY
jgi:hypothetical protein